MEGALSIRVPYRHLNAAELELVDFSGEIDDRDDGRASTSLPDSADSPSSSRQFDSPTSLPRVNQRSSLKTLILGSMIGAGVQFGWALQLSLLTPYIQTLGIEHTFSSFIWLCGPLTGFIVQPCVGVWSDKCDSKYGRRRPFIVAGCMMISLAVFLIGFASDIGYHLGDSHEHCKSYKGPRWRAAAVFIFGFWMLDLANNTVQGPARALLADLSGPDQRNSANAIFCCWMALGNILGFSSGANGSWHRVIGVIYDEYMLWWHLFETGSLESLSPLLNRDCLSGVRRCCLYDSKDLYDFLFSSQIFLMFCMLVTIYFAKEVPLEVKTIRRMSDSAPLLNDNLRNPKEVPVKMKPAHAISDSSPLLKDTHQNGFVFPATTLERTDAGQNSERNVVIVESNYGDVSNLNPDIKKDEIEEFNDGPAAVLVNILTSMRHLPPGMHSVLLVMAFTWLSWFPFFLFDTDWMGREVYHGDPNGNASQIEAYQNGVREGAFGLLLNSITYSVPFSVTAELTAGAGGGQGLATGVLNLAIVVPQMIVSLGAGPWDALFGGGNIPAFALAAIFSLAAGIMAVLKLPNNTLSSTSAGFHGFG
ncbi:Sucrose transport protein SUT4 [Apostasia shenzhenica]|uniref:Sucrose transport protein SUT4 n=1 Tax=Apostasia shenzhenica TaxID=1088818 RepID=A0A2I0ACF1_9ASPA|nr:Sucrose transport protein SUT4 [Apostasia shenzhenica]